ncbi:MAG TPA: hypothetical protein VEY71_09875 [Chitinophagales bacterium]|nr:hypothetical protein [Chitinophagales bacterium]
MEIIVHDNSKLVFIQEEFSSAFRYLKLEFPALTATGTARSNVTNLDGKTIADAAKATTSHTFTIVPTMTISTLKQRFIHDFGLPVQVMRRFGTTWVETTVTDGWTLEEQNKHGERLSLSNRR